MPQVVVAIAIVVIVMLLVSGRARGAANVTNTFQRRAFGSAAGIRKWVADYWRLEGERASQAARYHELFEQSVRKEYNKRRRRDPDVDIRTIRAELKERHPPPEVIALTFEVITAAWARRFMYLVWGFICLGFDYILTSTPAQLLFPVSLQPGADHPPPPPPLIFGAFSRYFHFITGAVLVAILVLSIMLLSELLSKSPAPSSMPFHASNLVRRARLGLTITLFIGFVLVIASLGRAMVSAYLKRALPLNDARFLIYLGDAVLVPVAILLAFPAVLQGLTALALSLGGGVVALSFALSGAVAWGMGHIFQGIDALGRRLWRDRAHGPDDAPSAG